MDIQDPSQFRSNVTVAGCVNIGNNSTIPTGRKLTVAADVPGDQEDTPFTSIYANVYNQTMTAARSNYGMNLIMRNGQYSGGADGTIHSKVFRGFSNTLTNGQDGSGNSVKGRMTAVIGYNTGINNASLGPDVGDPADTGLITLATLFSGTMTNSVSTGRILTATGSSVTLNPGPGTITTGTLYSGSFSNTANITTRRGLYLASDVENKVDGTFKVGAGSATLPGIQLSDTTLGLFRPATNVLGVSTAGAERLRVDATGQLGLGITAPTSTLHVVGTANVTSTVRLSSTTGGTAAAPLVQLTDTTLGLFRVAANSLGISTNSTERFRVDASGLATLFSTSGTAAAPLLALADAGLGFFRQAVNSLGITTAGVERMRIDASGLMSLYSTSGTATAPLLQFVDTTLGLFRPATNVLAVSTAGAERLRVDATGQLGLGITAPTSTLHVVGTANVTSTVRLSSTTGGTAAAPLVQLTDTTLGLFRVAANSLGISTNSTERFRVDASGLATLFSTSGTAAAPLLALADAGLGFFRQAVNSLGITTAGVERMRIDASGLMSLYSTSGTATAPLLQFVDTTLGLFRPATNVLAVSTAGAERLRVDATGQLGLGITAPTSTLHVVGTANVTSTVRLSSTTGGTAAAPLVQLTDTTLGLFRPATNVLAVSTAGVERLRVDASGLMSLFSTSGTATAPLLQMVDSTLGLFRPATNVLAVSTAGAERLRVDSTGQVGIGTTSPTSTLHVIGNALLTGTLTSAGVSTTTLTSSTATLGTATIGSLSGNVGNIVMEDVYLGAANVVLATDADGLMYTTSVGVTPAGNVTAGALFLSPGTSVIPATNSQLGFELTSNTTLTVRARGSDGVVRSVALTLA